MAKRFPTPCSDTLGELHLDLGWRREIRMLGVVVLVNLKAKKTHTTLTKVDSFGKDTYLADTYQEQ